MIVAALLGYLIGGLPTAEWIARLWGVDLRGGGSGNPGANNARRLGGAKLGLSVLVVEALKGTAVVAGASIGGGDHAVLAGVTAVVGNVLNPYRRFHGGQGLGISLGVLLAAWPTIVPVALTAVGVVAAALRRAPAAALSALSVLLIGAIAWRLGDLPIGWGLDPPNLVWLAVGMCVAVAPKQVANLVRDRRLRESIRGVR